jgi:hypothetical protein
LFSHVLHGNVQNHRITVLPDTGPAPLFRVFEVRSDGGADVIRPTAELVDYRVDATQRHGVGERYRVSPRAYHRSATLDPQLTVTVMLAENWTPEPQRVLGDVDLQPHTVIRRPCTIAETAVVIDTVLRHLEEDCRD